MRTIGKYEVVEKIGEGGFGSVYKGLDPHIKRFVAIKACTSEEQEIRDRFFHEAQIAGNLHHRHIVTVYDFGVQDEVPYLVQEYLSGEDLDRKVKRRDEIPLPEKLLYLIQVARGLEYAHSKGVIHRDIKPANIRILEDGSARIMDFGIAKLANQDTGLTQTGMTLGTAAYLAPEQIKGQPVGPATDIFSWGVTAWELLSYRRPFAGQHISTVLYQILNEQPPPLREHAPDCPPEIAAIVSRCLEKDPANRYPSCTELLAALDRTLRARRAQADPAFAPLMAESAPAAAAAVTRSVPAPAPPAASGETVTRPRLQGTAAAAVAGHPELGDFDLDATSDRTPHSISATQAVRSRGFAWGRWAAAVTAGVVLLLVAGLLAREALQRRARRAETTPAAAALLPSPTPALALAVSAGVPAVVVSPPPASPFEPAAEPAGEPTAQPTAAPTPTPRPAYLVVAAAWSPDVSVSVDGGRSRSLGTEQRFQVAPGAATRVRFLYRESDGYVDSAEKTVRVAAGESAKLTVPFGAPSVIQVQQRLHTPPGRVFLDGKAMAGGLVRERVRPGAHQLRVEPAGGGAGAPVDREVQVPPGQRLVLTFDLATGHVEAKATPLGPGG